MVGGCLAVHTVLHATTSTNTSSQSTSHASQGAPRTCYSTQQWCSNIEVQLDDLHMHSLFFNHQLHAVIPLLTSYIVSHLALLPHYSLDICEHPQGNHSACLSQSFWIVKCLPISTTEDPRRRFFWSSLMYPIVPLGYIITTPLCHLLVSCLSEGNLCVFNCPHFTQGIFQG